MKIRNWLHLTILHLHNYSLFAASVTSLGRDMKRYKKD